MCFTKHMSKNHEQNTCAKHPLENTPGKFIEEAVPLKNIHQIKSNYLQISLRLT